MADQVAITAADNETRRIIVEAVEKQQRDVPLCVNPAFASLDALLVEAAVGDVILAYNAGEHTLQGNNVVSGGTLAAMLDGGMAAAVLSALEPGQSCTTISLTVNLLRSAAPGRLYVRAELDKLGRNVAFAKAQLLNEDRKLLATATSSLAVIDVAGAQLNTGPLG